MLIRAVSCLAILAVLLTSGTAHAVVPTQDRTSVQIRALDKKTARVEEADIPVGKAISFGNLSVTARACRTTLPEETPPEATAYLLVEELHPGANSTPVFSGWMFASSPALSAMEHPIYDIWVIGCKGEVIQQPAAVQPPPSAVVPPPSK